MRSLNSALKPALVPTKRLDTPLAVKCMKCGVVSNGNMERP